MKQHVFFTKYEVYPEEGSTENENKNTFVAFKKLVTILYLFIGAL
jgi:hypothetical protein